MAVAPDAEIKGPDGAVPNASRIGCFGGAVCRSPPGLNLSGPNAAQLEDWALSAVSEPVEKGLPGG